MWPRLPVKTSGEIPKDQVLAACDELRRVRVQAPVKIGDVVLDDLLGTGCAVTATRDMPAIDSSGTEISGNHFGRDDV